MKSNEIILLDGGFGRELKERNIPINTALWSAEVFYRQPDLVETIHSAFNAAGADIITANTYALTRYNLEKGGKLHDHQRLIDMAYAAAKDAQAKAPHTRIAASIPPLTESFRPDLVDETRMKDEYQYLIDQALAHHVDIILCETLSSLAEVRGVCTHLNGLETETWMSFTVSTDGHLRSGESVVEAATIALDAGASAVLLNCSDIYEVTEGIKHFQTLSSERPFTFGAYANRFLSINKDFCLTDSPPLAMNDDVTPNTYVNAANEWVQRGATIIGGCCGIGPDYIRALNTLR